MQVWRRLGRFEEVEELDLGGEPSWKGIQCPMDKEELFLLLPEGEGALAGLRVLFLWWCANMVDYDFLRALASAGCGEKLTSLHLGGECCCLPVCDLMVCGSGSGRAGCVLLSVTGALSPFFSSRLLAFANAQFWKWE